MLCGAGELKCRRFDGCGVISRRCRGGARRRLLVNSLLKVLLMYVWFYFMGNRWQWRHRLSSLWGIYLLGVGDRSNRKVHYSHTPHIISHPLSHPLRIPSIELSYQHIMPRLAKAKKKPSEKEASGDGDGFEAVSSVGVGETTSLNLQRKCPRTARMTSKVAGSKKKSSKAATLTSEEPPSPEAGGRKLQPE